MHAASKYLAPLALFLALTPLVALAQPTEERAIPEPGNERLFGYEFEFAGNGNRIVFWDNMPWENYEKLMRVVVEHNGGNPADIRRVDFTKATTNLERYPSGVRSLFRAEWIDRRGRKWMIEPEFVASGGYDGYELVTPPLDNPADVEGLLKKIRASGLVREGLKSGVHLNVDGRRLVAANGDAKALANLILMHENYEPLLRALFNPVRGGGHANRFARSLAVDHEDILREIDRLAPAERTREKLEAIFKAREAREARLHDVDPMDPKARVKLWKYRAMNLAKVINVNSLHDGNLGVIEFRMFDLADGETHRLAAEFYRAMVRKAELMAEAGETVAYRPRASQPAGEDPGVYNLPNDPNQVRAKLREMIETVGLDPARFQPLMNRHVRARDVPTANEFAGMLSNLPGGRVLHNNKAFTYGFELEGTGEGFALIARPKNAEVNGRWDTMTDDAKREYYRSTVGDNRRSVPTHFELDRVKYPWLEPSWKVEGTGNWEIRSLPYESLEEVTGYMRLVKKLTGKSGKGFHLHMRDNGTDWSMLESRGSEFADFIERSSNWIWLERARRMGTMTSIKSWSNARMTPENVNSVATIKSSPRATVRVTVPYNKEYIDLEIRGFTKFVDDIETLAKIYTEALKTGNFGPWKHTANPLPTGGNGSNAPESLSFAKHFEEYMRDVEGRPVTPEMKTVIDGLQHDYSKRATGRPRTFATNVAVALLPWENEESISESLRRDIKFEREEFLRSLRGTANKVMSGEYGLEIDVANEASLKKHLGVNDAEATKLVEHRRAGNTLNAAGIKTALGESRGAAVATRLESAPKLDATEVSRQVRHKVKEWVEKVPLAEALLHSLLPRPRTGATSTSTTAPIEGEGFGLVRRGAPGEFVPSKVSYETVERVFEAVRAGAAARLTERLAATPSADAAADAAKNRVAEMRLEIVETNDILAVAKDGAIRVSTGLLNEIDARAAAAVPPAQRGAFRIRILALIMGHEAAHTSGIKAERVADAEGVRIYDKTAMASAAPIDGALIRETLKVFERPTGASHLDNMLTRLRSLFRYGTARGRLDNLERAGRGEVDPLAKYRRADGTLEWSRLTRDRALREGTGLGHFALALFLKEVATVAATGDRARIEEFFDGLMTTDFYTHYGLFVAGARIGEVAYVRYLQRFIKPGFVNGMLKTNLVLAAGIALPMIVNGTFEGRAFAISVGSLGLSSAAVKAGVAGIKWVMNLKKARSAGILKTVGSVGRLAKFGGWFYTAAELAVVLYVAEKIDVSINDALDLRDARNAIADAGEKVIADLNKGGLDAAGAETAVAEYRGAWIDYRNFLYRKLEMEEHIFATRLATVSRAAKIADDERKAAVAAISRHAALRANIVRRYGSVEAYAEGLVRESEGEIRQKVNTYVASYTMNRDKHLEDVYRSNERGTPLLGGVKHQDWLFLGGATGAADDPWGTGTDFFSNYSRSRARGALRDALEDASENRLEAYDDEAEVLTALAKATGGDAAKALTDAVAATRRLKAADEALISGGGMIDAAGAEGMDHAVEATSSR